MLSSRCDTEWFTGAFSVKDAKNLIRLMRAQLKDFLLSCQFENVVTSKSLKASAAPDIASPSLVGGGGGGVGFFGALALPPFNLVLPTSTAATTTIAPVIQHIEGLDAEWHGFFDELEAAPLVEIGSLKCCVVCSQEAPSLMFSSLLDDYVCESCWHRTSEQLELDTVSADPKFEI